jgi:hypothetical protein
MKTMKTIVKFSILLMLLHVITFDGTCFCQNNISLQQKQEQDTIQIAINLISDAIKNEVCDQLLNANIMDGTTRPLTLKLSVDKFGTTMVDKYKAGFNLTGFFIIKKPDFIMTQGGLKTEGDYVCGGFYKLYFKSGDKSLSVPCYFESGAITINKDIKSPCSFSEGSTFVYNSIPYYFDNSKWIKK